MVLKRILKTGYNYVQFQTPKENIKSKQSTHPSITQSLNYLGHYINF